MAESVRAYLQARGIDTDATGRCGTLSVTVSEEQGKVRVVVSGPTSQRDSRLVSDSATASVFVESRVRSDLALALPEPQLQPSAASPQPGIPALQPVAAHDSARDDELATQPSIPISLRFRPGVSFGSDGSSWTDLGVNACVHIDPLCVGVIVRGSLDLGVSGRSAELLTERAGLDVLVSTEFPFSLGQTMHFSPGIGLGAGWLRSGPRGMAETPSGDEVSADFGGLRVELFARTSWTIADRWSLGFKVGAVVDPIAHTGDIRDPNGALAGNPLVRAGAAFELTYGAP